MFVKMVKNILDITFLVDVLCTIKDLNSHYDLAVNCAKHTNKNVIYSGPNKNTPVLFHRHLSSFRHLKNKEDEMILVIHKWEEI